MALDSQINIYSVDTGNFYSHHERRLHNRNAQFRRERNYLNKQIKDLGEELIVYGYTRDDLKKFKKGDIEHATILTNGTEGFIQRYITLCKLSDYKRACAYDTKDTLLDLLANKVDQNKKTQGRDHMRYIDESTVGDTSVISVFSSDLNRTLGIERDELTDDIITIQVYYFDVFKDIFLYGFTFRGEKYRFYSSSAGQIRTKKAVFIKEKVWNKYEKTLLCGLTIDQINAKGGNNVKHMAYTALTNSATDVWENFDIDRTIVIEDFETPVWGTYDLIDDVDYSIERISDYVPIPHTDGAGMVLYGHNRMVRLPWVKGLLGVFDFRRLILEKGWSPIVKDIYGKQYNIIEEGIEVIFTKSQFKLWKFYDSWEDYKEKFKKYHCHANYCKVEEEKIGNTRINYQMLQTLTDVSDGDVEYIAQRSVDKLTNFTASVENIQRFFGVTPYNEDMTPLQEAIKLYPNLLNDAYLKNILRDVKNRLVHRYRAGKLEIEGKYTFLLPDFYAACEYWFGGEENPRGLLEDKEVYCQLYPNRDKLDCLRSPHLYKEHAIRNNVAARDYAEGDEDTLVRQRELNKWFDTNAVYTSCHDLISKILQFDDL